VNTPGFHEEAGAVVVHVLPLESCESVGTKVVVS
jgi:hypothetical protein